MPKIIGYGQSTTDSNPRASQVGGGELAERSIHHPRQMHLDGALYGWRVFTRVDAKQEVCLRVPLFLLYGLLLNLPPVRRIAGGGAGAQRGSP